MTTSPTQASWILSIDFGSTSSVVVAWTAEGGASVIEVDGERSVPSVVFIDDDASTVVGTSAVHLGQTRPGQKVRSPKRRLGNRAPIVIGGAAYSSVSLSAAIIRYAADEAIRQQGSQPSEVRLTYPAMWGSGLRTRLIDAAHEAGLASVRLIPEPIAAAFAAPNAPAHGEYRAIYDLGGGTFDTALVRATTHGFEVVGRPLGTDSVGGELLDEIIMTQVGSRLDPEMWDALQVGEGSDWSQAGMQFLAECRRVKEAVSSHPYAELRVATPAGVVHERVTREDVEAMVRPHLEETIELLRDVSAGVELASIHLVGGGSRMPLVQTMVAAAFGNVPIDSAGDPRVTVAIGAAAASTDPGSTREEGLAPVPQGIPLPGVPPIPRDATSRDAISEGASPQDAGATIADVVPPAGAHRPAPSTLEPVEPAAKRSLPMVLTGAIVALVLVGVGAMMVSALSDDPLDGGGETAAAESALTTVPTTVSADEATEPAADAAPAQEESVDDESVDEQAVPTEERADDSIGPFVSEIGPNLDLTGTYIVTTTDIDACVEGDLALRDDSTGEVGPTLATTSINTTISEGPQGLIALVEECDGRFTRLRIGSQLGGELSADSLSEIELSPTPTRLSLLSFDFIRQVPVGHAQFPDTGESWLEVQIGDDGTVQVIGPSAAQPRIVLSSEGLVLEDQLTGELIEFIGFGADSRTVLDLITPVRAGPGETVGAAGCIDTYLVAQMDGITLTFLPTGEFAGWFLRPDPGGPPLATANGVTLGTTVDELEIAGGRFLLDPAESGIGGFNVQIGDEATGTAGLINGFVLDDTGESELLEVQGGQNCPALVVSDN